MPTGGDALSTLFTELADADVFIDVITQSEAVGDRMNISFTVPEEASDRVIALLKNLLPRLGASEYSIDRDIAKVSIVGVGMRYHAGVASKAFAVLGAEGIATRMISTSEIKLSVVIDRKYCEVAVRALHDAFVELEPGTEITVGAEK
jgi:aspartate kinase